RPKRKPLNALRCPVRRDFAALHAPDFFRIRLEEDVEEPSAKLIADPVLKALGLFLGEELGFEIRQDAARRLDDSEFLQRFAGLERICEKMLVVKDARRPRAIEHVI